LGSSRWRVALAMMLVVVALSAVALGDYTWPQFQAGPERTGVQDSTSSEISSPKEMWSKTLLGGCPSVVGDVDGDGTPEVVVGTIDGKVYVLKSSTGETLWEADVDGAVKVAPALYDIDGDSKLEIVVGTDAGMLYAFDDDGSQRWTATNPFGKQPARLRLEALYSAAPFDSPGAVTVLEPTRVDRFTVHRNARNVASTLTSSRSSG